MIKAYLFKMEDSGWECTNPSCKHDSKYHFNIIGSNFHIKQGTTCLCIQLSQGREIFCRNCIDEVYEYLKPILDSKLWAFH